MQELIERLETMAPSDRRIVEHQIRRHLEGKSIALSREPPIIWLNYDRIRWEDGSENVWPDTPRYTYSIDAALGLKPEGYWWECVQTCAPDSPMRHFGSRNGIFTARIGKFQSDIADVAGHHDEPAIALCIASLKARSALLAKDAT